MKDEEKANGIESDMTDVEKALKDLIEREDVAEAEERTVDTQRKQNAAKMHQIYKIRARG